MTTATRTTIDLRIVGRRLPGLRWSCYDSVHVGVQRQRQAEIAGLVPGDAAEAVFDLPVEVVTDEAGVDFRGPFVQGRRGERFVYLSWGEVGPDGVFAMFRRAKLHLSALAEPEVTQAAHAGSRIEAVLGPDRRARRPGMRLGPATKGAVARVVATARPARSAGRCCRGEVR